MNRPFWEPWDQAGLCPPRLGAQSPSPREEGCLSWWRISPMALPPASPPAKLLFCKHEGPPVCSADKRLPDN